ncbi:MAG: precorrin-6A reductase [Sakamotonia sp.]|jgi:precorrin-6Y C5,15-methyltransferase (decarboxylating)
MRKPSMKTVQRAALFAGTTEGRLLAERLAGGPVRVHVFVATEYGGEGLPEAENILVHDGRMDAEEIREELSRLSCDLVLDATHPFARAVSENIRTACAACGIPCFRILREHTKFWRAGESGTGSSPVFVDSVEEAVEILKGTQGHVLVTTGSKELSKYKALPDWEERIYARVLSLPQVVSACGELGFYGSHLMAMQGPFSVEMNVAMLHAVGAAWMVTKESGAAGGFEEKVSAAGQAGAGLIVIGRPEEDGISLKEALELFGLSSARRKVFLVGVGPGDPGLLTEAARRAMEKSQVLAGAGRMADGLLGFHKPVLREYQPEKLLGFLAEHPEYETAAVALSGDTGFFSGAAKLLEAFNKNGGFEVEVIPGISSAGYFFSRIGTSWEDVRFISLHGRDADLEGAVWANKRVFILCGGSGALKEICKRLLKAGLSQIRLTIGENLSLESERILEGTPETMRERENAGLSVVLAENPQAGRILPSPLTHGLPDESFLRGKTPMTKLEVRSVSLSKLALTENAVVYDVGAGTGSVSVECARLSSGIRVFSIERDPEALKLLEENRRQFSLANMEIVAGTAPEALEGLPAPTHVFIGGSGGSMGRIVEEVLRKNGAACFVVNLITAESLAAVMELPEHLPVTDPEITMVTAARSKKAGKSHLMLGANPVWIVTFSGREDR